MYIKCKRLLLQVTILIVILLANSCNPTKRAYKQIEKLPPVTVADSLRLNKRSAATWPVKPDGVLIPGIPMVDTTIRDSTAFYKAKADSLKAVAEEILNNMEKDTVIGDDSCAGEIVAYIEGFKLGKETGISIGRGSCPPAKIRVDTLFRTPPEIQVQIGGLQTENSKYKDDNNKLTGERDTYEKQAKKRLYWLIGIIAVVVVSLGIWFYTKIRGGALKGLVKL